MKPRLDADAERGEWSIEKLVPGGDGMARLSDGRIAFVKGAFPGDVIRPLAVEARKGHVRATRFEITLPSPERVTPQCPVSRTCGGCDWMALARPAQISHKESLLRAALERTGGFSELPDIAVVAPGPELAYRNRVRFQVSPDGQIGFFAPGSHQLVLVPRCIVCRPEIDVALAELRRVPKSTLAAFSEIDVRVAPLDPVAIRLVPRVLGGAGPAARAVRAALPKSFAISVEGDHARDAPGQRYPLPMDVELVLLPGVFTQVNWTVNVALVEAVVEGARSRNVSRFLDAYAGAGNFTLPLLASGMRGTSVERDPFAVESARRAAQARGLDITGFVEGDAVRCVAEMARAGERFDWVLLDPPRAGARNVLRSVIRIAPRFVAFCSCDPVTLARDLGTLARAGYHLDEVRGFDMFPQTHHLETMAWMSCPE